MYFSYISYTHQPSSHHHAIFHHLARVSSTDVDARPAHRVSTTDAGAVIVRRHSYADERRSKRAVGSVSCHAVPVHFQFVSCRAHAWHEHSGGPVLGCGQHECRRTYLGVHHAVCRRIVAGVFRIDATHSGNVDVDYDERCDADCHRLTVFAGFVGFVPVHRFVANVFVSDEECGCGGYRNDGKHGWRDRACCAERGADLWLVRFTRIGYFRRGDFHGDFPSHRTGVVCACSQPQWPPTFAVVDDVASGCGVAEGFLEV